MWRSSETPADHIEARGVPEPLVRCKPAGWWVAAIFQTHDAQTATPAREG